MPPHEKKGSGHEKSTYLGKFKRKKYTFLVIFTWEEHTDLSFSWQCKLLSLNIFPNSLIPFEVLQEWHGGGCRSTNIMFINVEVTNNQSVSNVTELYSTSNICTILGFKLQQYCSVYAKINRKEASVHHWFFSHVIHKSNLWVIISNFWLNNSKFQVIFWEVYFLWWKQVSIEAHLSFQKLVFAQNIQVVLDCTNLQLD